MNKSKSVLLEAEELVNGDRLEEYGPVYENLIKVGKMAGLMLSSSEKMQLESAMLTPTIICKIMIAMKLSRQSTFAKRDNLVDLAGYTFLLDEIIAEEEQREMELMLAHEKEQAKNSKAKKKPAKKKGKK